MTDKTITAVCGLGRCGSTLMMRMLHAGGMDVFCENKTDFENGLIFSLPDNHTWLKDCAGKAFKLLDPHKNQPHPGYKYRFIWLTRDPKQQALSQIKLLRAAGHSVSRKNMRAFKKSIPAESQKAFSLLIKYGPVLHLHFENIIEEPTAQAIKVKDFTGYDLDIKQMIKQVIPRSARCYNGMLENRL